MIAYIREQGAKITREGRRLIVTTPDVKHTLFIDHLEQLLLFGNIQVTAPALFLLLGEDIDTVFLRADGRFMGRLATKEPANVFLRKKQFDLTEDAGFCVRTARRIVQAKLVNQATLLARVKRSRGKDVAGDAAKELRRLACKAQDAEDVDSLRGIEGRGAAVYFRHLPLAFNQDWGFTRRVRRPPTDPVNAVLSLLYTLLINRCYAAVRIAGLDPHPAVLHTLAYGRYSLPLDMVEEFRAMLADALTISLFNMRMLDWDDFESPEPVPTEEQSDDEPCMAAVLRDSIGMMSSEDALPNVSDLSGEQMDTSVVESISGKRPMLLRKGAFKTVLTAFSKKLETEFSHPAIGKQMSYSEALVFQARQFRRLVEGEIGEYSPLTLR